MRRSQVARKILQDRAIVLALVLSVWSVAAHAADVVTQQIPLSPGWNAVFLQVQPDPADPEAVFAGVPVESVWTWSDRKSSVEFLIDPSELEWNGAEWLAFRTNPAHRILTDLNAVIANRAYLIKLSGASPVNWNVTGRPSTQPAEWVADAFNLAGFPSDPAGSISLAEMLAPSPAHLGQAVYRLDTASGLWEFVDNPATVQARAGEAYWVYTDGGSSYQGPWFLDIVRSDGIDFGASVSERLVRITNVSNTARVIQISELASASAVGVAYKSFDGPTATFEWESLGGMPAVTVPAGGTATVTLAVRRESLGSPVAGSVLEFKDGQGIRFLVPVRAIR